jgi:hypothetical protein
VPHAQTPPDVHVSAVMPHAAQVPPPVPHCPGEVGLTHDVPLQQPVAHDAALQMHDPPEHTWPAPHSGPEPHSQAPLAEHPLARAPLHALHVAPSVPQRVRVGGDMHTAPSQQPEGHDVELHTQTPPAHSCPAAHAVPAPHWQPPEIEQLSARVVLHTTHAAPSVPQLVGEGISLHVDPEQHPVAQPVELQSPGHTPPLHAPVVQAAHAAPPVPH